MINIYISNDKKAIKGKINGIEKIERRESGFIIGFSNYDKAYRAAQTFMNSGYETVKILQK